MFLSKPRQDGPITFAAGGEHDPPSLSLADLGEDLQRLGRVVGAAYRSQLLVDNTYARQEATEQAVDRRIAAVKRATGVTLENYARIAPTIPTMTGLEPEPSPESTARDTFHSRLLELQDTFPQHAADIRADVSIEDDARASAKNAEAELQTLMADPKLGAVTGFGAALAGGIGGSFRDPLQVSTLFFGGGAGTAGNVILRIGQVALREAAWNAGAVALTQPQVQAWRADAGLRSGVVPAIENIGLGALFGSVFGSGAQVVRELSPAGRAAAQKLLDGTATPSDVARMARDPVLGVTERENGALGQLLRDIDAERLSAPPGGIAKPSADDVLAQAIRHAEDPVNNPPPEIALPVPKRPAAIERIVDESRAVELGAVEMVGGKPVTFERFDPRALSTDAATFQYKGGGDNEGVTERLRYVTQWDPIASGKGIVWERADGHLFVADGHQRLGLARRLISEAEASRTALDDASAGPAGGIFIDGFRFREADGWSAADVRAMAAKKNLQEGSGDALDAARILRERPDILDGKLPITGPMMKTAMALSKLSDEAFGAALNGLVPPNHAAAIGAMVPDPKLHSAILADLVRFAPETEREARLLIGDALAAGFRSVQQIDLFGAAQLTRSLMGERVKVLDRALTDLSQNKKLFGTLSARADTIEGEAANVLDRFGNQLKANQAARLADVLTRLAQRTGPVSDALNRAAARVTEGQKPGAAARQFLDDVEGLLTRDGLDGLLAEPKLKPAHAAEPGTPEAAQIAATAANERFGGEGPMTSAGATRQRPSAADPGPQITLEQLISPLDMETRTDILAMSERGAPEAARASALRALARPDLPKLTPAEIDVERRGGATAEFAAARDRASGPPPESGMFSSAGAVRRRQPPVDGGNRLQGLEEVEPGIFTIPIFSDRAEPVGRIGFTIGDRAVTVKMAALEDPAQAGQGFARHAYERLIRWTLDSGRAFQSDANVTPDAARVYDALEKRGYQVTRDEGARYAGSAGDGFNAQAPGAIKVTAYPHDDGLRRASAANERQAPDRIFDDFIAGQRGVTLEQLHARAQALQTELAQAGTLFADRPGVRFLNPGVKKFDDAARKITRKGYDGPERLTDLARAGFVVRDVADADAVIADLSKRFDVLDEGWKVNAFNYADRKLLVRGADGTVAEIQVMPEAIYKAKKDGGGHQLYDRSRALPPGPERTALINEQVALYSAATRSLGADWAGIFDRSSAPNEGSNLARQSPSGMTPAVSATSSSSTLDQAAPGRSTANADPKSSASTAGRASQSQNFMGKPSAENISAPAAADKTPSLFEGLAIGSREDGKDMQLVTREAALADADRTEMHADLFASCKD